MKFSLKTAFDNKTNHFDVSSTHVTTLDVGQIRPTNILPLIKGDKVKVDLTEFSRLAPLVAPTFGTLKLKTHAFWIPLHTIFPNWEDFLRDSKDPTSDLRTCSFSLRDLYGTILSDGANTWVDPSVESNWVGTGRYIGGTDSVLDSSGICDVTGPGYRKMWLTTEGRWLFNVLSSLGYEFPVTFVGRDLLLSDDYRFSAYPLLAFARVLYDWIYPSRYVDAQGFQFLFKEYMDGQQDSPSYWLPKIFELLFCCYDPDFFNQLWAYPNQPAYGVNNTYSFNSGEDSVSVNNDDTYISTEGLSARGQRMLQAVSDFITRNNIGGSRFQEFVKSHFGFVSQPEKHNQSKFLKSWQDVMNIQDVTATSEGSSVLGQQAGKGFGSVNGQLSFEADEYGFLLFVSSVIPETGYYQGTKPWTLPVNSREDVFLPEFDSLVMEAIPKRSVLADPISYDGFDYPSRYNLLAYNEVFGFAPKYMAKYKNGYDYLTGDFRFGSRNVGLDSYHTFLDLKSGKANTPLRLDADFLQVSDQFDRIFASAPSDSDGKQLYDKIFTIFRFKVDKWSHMKSVSESFPIFDKSGNSTSVDAYGAQLN